MELNDLKSSWKKMNPSEMSKEQLNLLLSKNTHPVLKKIRTQAAVEAAGWSVFLACYYSMFDGSEKSILANVVLVVSIMLALVHHFAGFQFFRNVVLGEDIVSSLKNYTRKAGKYSTVSILLRALFMAGLLFFFCSGLTFSKGMILALSLIVLVFAGQLYLLSRIWKNRLDKLKSVTEQFTSA
ncbi:hypothetical protein [Pararcticibacter amylolyticus]|uniref:Uncharacterized protein n=1 Tax=Pararcticibacter amylolyticus TaxID=2173175 RepID=A0A2U2PGB8_9SPHI|nr:hypothetical protein [Pararcticibacter amylolyticus]PWG80400.1 hypothetical protein DDR33_12385 [Pararcticibacter amylolyticus]